MIIHTLCILYNIYSKMKNTLTIAGIVLWLVSTEAKNIENRTQWYLSDSLKIENRNKEGKQINDELKDKIIYTNEFIQDNTNYRSLYFSTKSSIFDDTKVIFSILLDESEYYKKMENINYHYLIID